MVVVVLSSLVANTFYNTMQISHVQVSWEFYNKCIEVIQRAW